jgi:hypothetical protein
MPKTKIDLQKPLLELDGSDSKGDPLAKWLANMLKVSRTGDAIKYLDWAIELTKSGVLELDDSDYDALKQFIKEDSTVVNLVKGQLLREFLNAKNTPKP